MRAFGGSTAPAFHRSPWVLAAFALYALTLVVMTHWPRLTVPGPEGTDKHLHIGAFAVWALLFTACGWFGRPLSDSNLFRSLLVSAVYAGIDEGLQGIEWIHRSCEWGDLGANMSGVVAMVILLLSLRTPLSRAFPKLLPE